MSERKRNSAAITEGPSRAPAGGMPKAVGFTDEDLCRPIIGIANTWTEIGPCHFQLRELAAAVKRGVSEHAATAMERNIAPISECLTKGTAGTRTSRCS